MNDRDKTIEGLRREVESLRSQNAVLRRENEAIRESETRYRTLYDALPVSLQVVDKSGIITGVNPFHVKNMGKGRTTENDYLGQYICERPSIVASGIAQDFARTLRGVPFEKNEVHFPALSGGGEGWFNVRGVPLTLEGRMIGAIYISMDVEQLKRAKDELQHHKEQLEELVEARTADVRVAYEKLREEDAIRRQVQQEREKLIVELQAALAKVKTLSGFIPICASCKKIRDDKGFWNQIEAYLSAHSDLEFSHSVCPECAQKLYDELKGSS